MTMQAPDAPSNTPAAGLALRSAPSACAWAAVAAMLCAYAPGADAASDAVCRPATSVPAVAAAAHVGPADVAITTLRPGITGCPNARSRRAATPAVPVVKLNVDSGPQARFRLDRTVTEASQIFGVPLLGWHPPIGLTGSAPTPPGFPSWAR